MKYLLAGIVAFFAFASVATADARNLPPPSPPVYSWTGCYAGVNGGYGWNEGNTGYKNDSNAPNGDPINFVPDPAGTKLQYIATPSRTDASGALAGGSAGCNWQSQQWVYGIEGDIDWAHISGSSSNSVNSGTAQFGIGPGLYTGTGSTGTANEQVSLQWLSTIRGRVGFAIQDRILLYATGGLAMGASIARFRLPSRPRLKCSHRLGPDRAQQ